MRKESLFILIGFIFLLSSSGFANRAITIADSGRRTALVIGNANYRSVPLDNPVNDARNMADLLRDLGFDVIEEINADRYEMDKAVQKFYNSMDDSEVGFFYYAGHGMQIKGINYLIPVGLKLQSSADIKHRAIKTNWILSKMEDADSRVNIVVLDACRNNPFRGIRGAETGLAPPVQSVRGTFIAYATAPGKVAMDGSGENGIYTKHLLENLKRPGLTVEEVFREVRKDVVQDTNDQQISWDSSSLVGAFYLAGGSAVIEEPQEREKQSRQPTSGSLKVRTEPRGAEITINNTPRGPAPVSLSGLSPGSYRVRAEKDGYEAQKKRVQVRAGRTATVRLYLDELIKTGRLYVHPTPEDARVRIMNITPQYYDGIELEPGRYEIRVDKRGYETADRVERLAAGEDLDVYIELEKKQVAQVQSGGTPRAGETWTEPVTGMEFVWVEGGCYQMGSENGNDDEEPVHEVCVDGFWMGKYEVTQGEWEEIMGNNPSGFDRGDNYPVERVSWNDCQDFIDELSSLSGRDFRLPTEAEWEYAARGGTKSVRFWGDDADDACRYANVHDQTSKSVNGFSWSHHDCDDGYKVTAPVGNFRANPYGLYDMLGNVWEWCGDVYDSGGYSRHSRNNPKITSGGSWRVFRGGSWGLSPRYVRAAIRNGDSPGFTINYLGFRLCFPPVR